MNSFAALLDRLFFDASRNGKLRLMTAFFKTTPDPERGWALAALTGELSFRNAKPGLLKSLMAARMDPELFAMSYDYVGDLAETTALLWEEGRLEGPSAPFGCNHPPLALSDIVETLSRAAKSEVEAKLASWLDQLTETGRWALLKLITGALRIGVSARLAKTALAQMGGPTLEEIESVWHGLEPPYRELFAWIEGRAARPAARNPAPFHPVMLAHPLDAADLAALTPADFRAEWKWDGVRLQAVMGRDAAGAKILRLYTRAGEEISAAFPDLAGALLEVEADSFALDGELLIVKNGAVETFNSLQQRLNRKTASPKLLKDCPAHLRAYDLLSENGEDLRPSPFDARRARLEAFVARARNARLDASPLIAFDDWSALAAARANPSERDPSDAQAAEGVMLKRADSAYIAGRPTGPWWKWKRDPYRLDAVLMYAQRGHGKRGSLFSDFTFGVWRAAEQGKELTPLGKAYFGFTDEELKRLNAYIRDHTAERYGPVTALDVAKGRGLVVEIAFEGVARSKRHKSGLALRFPRISRIRWDKPAEEADWVGAAEAFLKMTPPTEAAAPFERGARSPDT